MAETGDGAQGLSKKIYPCAAARGGCCAPGGCAADGCGQCLHPVVLCVGGDGAKKTLKTPVACHFLTFSPLTPFDTITISDIIV
jgi:hypothetical protein